MSSRQCSLVVFLFLAPTQVGARFFCLYADLDLESKLWLKIRLAPMCPWIGTLGLGFVGSPSSELRFALLL